MFCLLAGALLLSACGTKDIYANVSESEANDMIAALMAAGIDGEKVAGEKGAYTVRVNESDFGRSVDVLRENGLPREKFESLGTIFKKEGFTSSALAERARLVYGLQQELEHTITEFDGVVQARVHLAMPEADALTGVSNPSSASVFVKYRPGFDLRSQTAAIKALVTNSIEGLAYDKVSVVMTEAKPAPVPPAPRFMDRAGPAVAWLLGMVGMVLLIVGGWLVWRRRGGAVRQRDLAPRNVRHGGG